MWHAPGASLLPLRRPRRASLSSFSVAERAPGTPRPPLLIFLQYRGGFLHFFVFIRLLSAKFFSSLIDLCQLALIYQGNISAEDGALPQTPSFCLGWIIT